eukprot:2337797-Pyramimonas_sp.AAC.1
MGDKAIPATMRKTMRKTIRGTTPETIWRPMRTTARDASGRRFQGQARFSLGLPSRVGPAALAE